MTGYQGSQTDDGHLQFTSLVPVKDWVVEGSLIMSNGVVKIVDKVNPKNYVCYDEAGQGWNVRITNQTPLPRDHPFDRTKYLEKKQAERDRKNAAFHNAITSDLTLGSVVKFTHASSARKFPGLYVVCIVPNAQGKMRLAKLGGDGGQYVRGVSPSHVEQVPQEEWSK